MREGTVVKSTGSWYIVKLEDNSIIESRIIGKFRLNGISLTNPVAVGDQVMIEMESSENTGIIKEILPRKNYVIRQSPRKKHQLHLLASNIDQALLIVTIKEPNLKQGFIDRFLIMTEPYDIPVHIAFNKCDIYNEDDMAICEYLEAIYTNIGYHFHMISALEGTGLDELRAILKGKTTLFSGQSGVGKSSLVNSLNPDFSIRTEELSKHTGKGQHTTTFAEMIDLDEDTSIIDTPGIKTLAFNHLEVMDVAHNFRELFILSKKCKFADCSHRNEPSCAVKNALEEGRISELRYNNYIKIIEEIEDQNYWERHSDY
jgi:ribosome biogenesis GTPase